MAVYHQSAAIPEHKAGSNSPNDLRIGAQLSIELHLGHTQRKVVLHCIHKLFSFILFPHKRFYHGYACKLLLQNAQHHVPLLAKLLAERPYVLDKKLVVDDIEGNHADGDEAEAPLHTE